MRQTFITWLTKEQVTTAYPDALSYLELELRDENPQDECDSLIDFLEMKFYVGIEEGELRIYTTDKNVTTDNDLRYEVDGDHWVLA